MSQLLEIPKPPNCHAGESRHLYSQVYVYGYRLSPV